VDFWKTLFSMAEGIQGEAKGDDHNSVIIMLMI